jgi:hypothetical protein
MKGWHLVATLAVSVAIFYAGYHSGKSSNPYGQPAVTTEITVTADSGLLVFQPARVELRNGEIITDTVTIYRYEQLPDEGDTVAVYSDYYTERTYNRTYGTDTTYSLALETTVKNNRILAERYTEKYVEKTRVERYPVLSTPTKWGVSVHAPFSGEWVELRGHLLLKQKVDFSIGYSSRYRFTGGVAYFF